MFAFFTLMLCSFYLKCLVKVISSTSYIYYFYIDLLTSRNWCLHATLALVNYPDTV